MKLSRVESTTQSLPRESIARAELAVTHTVRRVEAAEGIVGDRERSIQQEIAEIEPKAIGQFEGTALVLEGAREVAAQLTRLGDNARGLVKLRALSQQVARIDDAA